MTDVNHIIYKKTKKLSHLTIGERLVTCVSQKIQPSLCAQLPINNSYFCFITPFLRIQHVLDSMLENFV